MKMVRILEKLLKMENRCSSTSRGNFSISQPNENVLSTRFRFYMHASMQINNSKYNLSLLTTLSYVPWNVQLIWYRILWCLTDTIFHLNFVSFCKKVEIIWTHNDAIPWVYFINIIFHYLSLCISFFQFKPSFPQEVLYDSKHKMNFGI